MTRSELWWRHARPAVFWFLVLVTLMAVSRSDLSLAHSLFFDPMHRHWIGAGSWWANEFFHTGGRWLIRCVAAVGIAVWIASCLDGRLRALRRPAAYFVLSLALSIAAIGLLKLVTNVDCPWDLREFGGRYPYVALFGHRPDLLRAGRCFPAAHASSGYALFALYFLARERSRRWAKVGMACALLVGAAFGLAQQSRGAHFLSHDVWSAFLVWMISLTIYAVAFRARLWDAAESVPTPARAATAFGFVPVRFADPAVVHVRVDDESRARRHPRPPGH